MVGDESRKSFCFRLAARSNPVLETRLCISFHLSTVIVLEVNRQLAGPFPITEPPLPLLKQPIRDRAYQEGQGNHGQAHGVGSLVRQGKQHVRRGRLPNSSISRMGGGANKRQEPRFRRRMWRLEIFSPKYLFQKVVCGTRRFLNQALLPGLPDGPFFLSVN